MNIICKRLSSAQRIRPQNFMRIILLVFLGMFLAKANADYIEVKGVHVGLIKILPSGNIYLEFEENLMQACYANGKLVKVYEGEENLSSQALERAFSVMMLAKATDAAVNVIFNNDSKNCYFKGTEI